MNRHQLIERYLAPEFLVAVVGLLAFEGLRFLWRLLTGLL